jgi:hypothetical protein
MLADLAQDLDRQGANLVVAHDVGQVRDVLRRAEVPGIEVGVHPTVDAAVHAALRGTGKDRVADPRSAPRMIRAPEPDPPAPSPTPTATVRLRHRIGENRGVLSRGPSLTRCG